MLLALVNDYSSSKKINAFTFHTGDELYDELPWVEKMISQTGNPLKKVKLSAGEVPEYAKLLSDVQEEPFGGIPTIAYSKIFEKRSLLNLLSYHLQMRSDLPPTTPFEAFVMLFWEPLKFYSVQTPL